MTYDGLSGSTVMFFNDVQPLNALYPRFVKLAGMLIVSRASQPPKISNLSNISIPSGRTTVLRFLQSANAHESSFFTPLGIVNVEMGTPLKARSPISVSLPPSANSMVCSWQPEKAQLPIDFSLAGNEIVVNPLQPIKAA